MVAQHTGADTQHRHHPCGTDKCAEADRQQTARAHHAAAQCAAHQEQTNGCAQPCAGIDAKDGGIGQGIIEHGLHQQARHSQCAACQ